MDFPVRRAFVVDFSLFIDAGPFGEIAVAPEHYQGFLSEDHHRPALRLALSKYPNLKQLS
jgi:hypothetical protein